MDNGGLMEAKKQALMHESEVRVRGFHVDVYQHLNNARYLEFLEDARWHFFDEMQLTSVFTAAQCAMAVININISYRKSAYFGDDLVITTFFSKLQSRKAELRQIITLKNTAQVIADATVAFTGFDQQTKKAIAFPSLLMKKMQTLLAST